MEAFVNIIKGDSIGLDTEYKDSLPVNMYAVQKEILGAKGYLVCYPGLTTFGVSVGPDRGAVYNERMGLHFRVSGNKLISVNKYGSIVDLGEIPGEKQVSMPYSFNTQAIVTDGRVFLYSLADGLIEITDTDLGSPFDGVWIDGYYFFVDGEYIFHTDIADESSIVPLSFGTAEFMPDQSIAVAKTQDDKAIVFGRYSIEYFEDIATPNFAFQRMSSRAQKIGIVSTHAKCEVEGFFYILGGRKNEQLGIHVISIGNSVKVSTKEIDSIISQYTEDDLVNVRIEARKERDTTFVIVHLPQHTLCFNETLAAKVGYDYAWTELRTGEGNYLAINGIYDARISKFVYGDKYGYELKYLDYSLFSQSGVEQEFILDSPFVYMGGKSIDIMEMNTIPGRNSVNDATVAFSITTDGTTYSHESWSLYGSNDEYNNRFIALRLGYISNWVGFRFRGKTKSRMSFSGMKISYA